MSAMITRDGPRRRVGAEADRQAACGRSSLSGEPVALSGTYITKSTLFLRGAHVIGQLSNHSGSWGNNSFTDKGNSAIYYKGRYDAIICSLAADTKQPCIENLAVICSHATMGAVDTFSAGIFVFDKRCALTMRNVLIHGANTGLYLGPSTCEHYIDHLTIKSPRSYGIYTVSSHTVVDCRFRDIYIAGKQYEDFEPKPAALGTPIAGIYGVPASSSFHGRTIIESFPTAIKTGAVLNQYFDDLFIDNSLGVGIELGEQYNDTLWAKQFDVGRLHFQAGVKMAKVWTWPTKRRPFVKVGSHLNSINLAGASLDLNSIQPPAAS